MQRIKVGNDRGGIVHVLDRRLSPRVAEPRFSQLVNDVLELEVGEGLRLEAEDVAAGAPLIVEKE